LQDALFEGGKSYDNPLWNLTLLCSTFMEKGNELAHEMSKGNKWFLQIERTPNVIVVVGPRYLVNTASETAYVLEGCFDALLWSIMRKLLAMLWGPRPSMPS
jgi:hypothetical protein